MRIFYENLVTPIENVYDSQNTLENILFIEDILKDISKDTYIQYKTKLENNINHSNSNITINGTIKCKNHLYFINNYKSTFFDYIDLLNSQENLIKVSVMNSNISLGDPYVITIHVNDVLVETLEYDDTYSLYNRKDINIHSTKLGVYITVTLPLYFNVGENVVYKAYTINVTKESSVHKYLATFDKINNAIIFDKKYIGNELNILVQSCGSILRSSTINELYRVNAGSFVQFDESTNTFIIPREQLFKSGPALKYILNQNVTISTSAINSGYNLIGIYLDNNDNLTYDSIIYDVSYSTLLSRINNYQLDTLRKTRNYYGFVIGLNNIVKFIPTDIFLYNVGAGGGEGGGINKIMFDTTDVLELEINYVAGTQTPIVTVFDRDGDLIVPELVHYNLQDTITITFGEIFNGLVCVV